MRRAEPALAQLLGRTAASLAVPAAARALFTAGLAGLTRRRPLVLAVPTSSEAERLAHDLAAFLGVWAVFVMLIPINEAVFRMVGRENAAAVCADLRDVSLVLAAPSVRHLIDFTRPVGIIAVDVLHLLAEADDPLPAAGDRRGWWGDTYPVVPGDRVTVGVSPYDPVRGIITFRAR